MAQLNQLNTPKGEAKEPTVLKPGEMSVRVYPQSTDAFPQKVANVILNIGTEFGYNLVLKDISLCSHPEKGVYLLLPSRKYQDKDGQDKYSQYFYFTGKKENTEEMLNRIITEYNKQVEELNSKES